MAPKKRGAAIKISELRKLAKRGVSDAEIARKFGCSRRTVSRQRRLIGIESIIERRELGKKGERKKQTPGKRSIAHIVGLKRNPITMAMECLDGRLSIRIKGGNRLYVLDGKYVTLTEVMRETYNILERQGVYIVGLTRRI